MARKKLSAKPGVGRDSLAHPAGNWLWSKKAEPFLPAFIAAAGILAYCNGLQGPFIFDDRYHIVENPLIRTLWPPWPLLVHSSRPAVLVSLAVNYALGGLNPWGYHVLNVLIHILAALVLFGVVRRTFLSPVLRARWGSAAPWLAALISTVWLVHPIQTESVTYTIQRGESMMGLFYLLTLYCVIRMGSRAGWWWAVAAVASCLLGMATKGGVMVTAPILVLLYDRVFLSPSWRELARRRWILYGALAAAWVSYPFLLAAAPAEWRDSAGFGFAGAGPLQYAMTQPGVILYYLRLALWPDLLCLDYGWPVVHSAGEVWPQLIALGGLLWAAVWAWRRNPPLGFLGAWFFLVLAPTSSFIPIADAAVEHRLYLPLAAVVTLLAVAAFRLAQPKGRWILAGVAAVLVVLILAGLTARRNLDYASKLTIWQDAARKSPNNPRAHYNLGEALEEVNDLSSATVEYRQAVQLNPKYVDALTNLGHVLSATGKPGDAVEYLQRALRLQPDLAKAHNLLGYSLVLQDKVPEAVSEWRQALALKPDYAEPHNNLGIVLAQQGKIQEAIDEWKQAVRYDPDSAEAHNNLAYFLSQQGNVREAVQQYEQAIRAKPDFFTALVAFAKLLANPGPGAAGDPTRAVSLAERACELPGHRDAACLDTLASCDASANQMEDAVRTAETALALARSAGEMDLAKQIEARLELYRGKLRGGSVIAPPGRRPEEVATARRAICAAAKNCWQ